MPDPQSRIKRFRDRAEECMNIAESSDNAQLRLQYMQVAESYLKLIELELSELGESDPK